MIRQHKRRYEHAKRHLYRNGIVNALSLSGISKRALDESLIYDIFYGDIRGWCGRSLMTLYFIIPGRKIRSRNIITPSDTPFMRIYSADSHGRMTKGENTFFFFGSGAKLNFESADPEKGGFSNAFSPGTTS